MEERSIGRRATDLPLSPDLLDRVVEKVLALAPEPLAVVLSGSYARGDASDRSDLDLNGLFAGPLEASYRTWFEERAERPLQISAGVRSLQSWRARSDEPARWSLGFPTEEAALFLWATDEARAALGEPPTVRRPADYPELEDLVESAMKVRTSRERDDPVGVRWYAHDLATRAPRALLGLNPVRRVTSYRDALEAALTLPVVPDHYREDIEVCLGLVAGKDERVASAALRLALETLALLRERAPDVDTQPWVSRYLADGTFERHIGG
jgi:phosphoribosyl-AMP cyclohydrolase